MVRGKRKKESKEMGIRLQGVVGTRKVEGTVANTFVR